MPTCEFFAISFGLNLHQNGDKCLAGKSRETLPALRGYYRLSD